MKEKKWENRYEIIKAKNQYKETGERKKEEC
jgi:hypothetical protein